MPAGTPSSQSFRITALYAFTAAMWILFSDQAIGFYIKDPAALTFAATVKGWFFVAVTAAMLFVLVRRQLRSVEKTSLARLQAEQAVRVSEERFRSLAALSPDIISIFDREGSLTFNSAAAFKVHGYRDEDMLGRSTFDLVHPDDREKVQAAFASILANPTEHLVVRYRYKNANGTYTWMEAAARNELGNPHLQGVIAISRDISERVRSECQLRESEERFQRVVASISDVLFASDLQGAITFIGAQVSQFGYTPKEVIGRRLLEFVVPEDQSRVAGEFQKAISAGSIIGAEFRIRAKDGTVAWVQESSGFILDENGKTVGVSGVLRNITDKKRAEEERRGLQDQLTHAQKMEAIGQLAGGVAHDFNNILTIFSLHLGVLQDEPLPAPVLAACAELSAATGRASSLTRQLLLFARRQVVQKREIDPDVLLGRLLNMLRRLIGENIVVEYQCAPRATWVLADAGMLEQVVMNLAVNARDAMPQGGRLRISTEIRSIDDDAAAKTANPRARAGSFVCLGVSDTGCGMDAEIQRKIFEPFFTTKEAGKGTGLGLATVFGIVQQHDGWIEVESAIGQGSTFRIYLPEVGQAATEENLSQSAVQGGSESILVAEDDPAIRQLTRETLRRLGYRVATAGNGPEALEVWTENNGSFDLLLTDMIMPGGLTGLDLAERLQQAKPGLRTMVMSGYSLELSQHGAFNAAKMAYLPKPFDTLTLSQKVRQVLSQPAA